MCHPSVRARHNRHAGPDESPGIAYTGRRTDRLAGQLRYPGRSGLLVPSAGRCGRDRADAHGGHLAPERRVELPPAIRAKHRRRLDRVQPAGQRGPDPGNAVRVRRYLQAEAMRFARGSCQDVRRVGGRRRVGFSCHRAAGRDHLDKCGATLRPGEHSGPDRRHAVGLAAEPPRMASFWGNWSPGTQHPRSRRRMARGVLGDRKACVVASP